MKIQDLPWRKAATLSALVIGAFFAVVAVAFAAKHSADKYLVYVGTYTGPKSKGIYGLRFDPGTGRLEQIGLVGEVESPSFLTLNPAQNYLYAISEISGKTNGFVSSFSLDKKSGMLKFLNKVSTGGTVSCHLVVDKTNSMLLVANYGSGSVASFRVKPDGTLSESTAFDQHSGSSVDQRRQRGPHAHAVVLSADNHFVFVPELGLDEIFSYRIDPAQGTFTANDPPTVRLKPGSGPRHFAFHPNNKYAYSINEMGSSVTAFTYDAAQGRLQELQTMSTLPEGFNGVNNSAEIQLDKAGHFVYASNRGNDSITVFSVDSQKGTLTKVQVVPTEGKTPRNFSLDPTGQYLLAANQDSDTIVVFKVDKTSGRLTPSGQTLSVPSPVCIQFVPAA